MPVIAKKLSDEKVRPSLSIVPPLSKGAPVAVLPPVDSPRLHKPSPQPTEAVPPKPATSFFPANDAFNDPDFPVDFQSVTTQPQPAQPTTPPKGALVLPPTTQSVPVVQSQPVQPVTPPQEAPSTSQSTPTKVEKAVEAPKPVEKKPDLPECKLMFTVFNDLDFTPSSDLEVGTISEADRKRYLVTFDIADSNKDGFVDGGEAKLFFNSSTLERKMLAQIWRLADTLKRGRLDKDDFVLAMHYTLCAIKRLEVPTVLPPQFRRPEPKVELKVSAELPKAEPPKIEEKAPKVELKVSAELPKAEPPKVEAKVPDIPKETKPETQQPPPLPPKNSTAPKAQASIE
jgi:hypothetical protein